MNSEVRTIVNTDSQWVGTAHYTITLHYRGDEGIVDRMFDRINEGASTSYHPERDSTSAVITTPFTTNRLPIATSTPEHNPSDQLSTPPTTSTPERTRKRHAKPLKWKKSVAKKKRQHGQEYVDRTGVTREARAFDVRKNCGSSCRYKCTNTHTVEEQEDAFEHFWLLGHAGQQHHFKHTIAEVQSNIRDRSKFQGKRITRVFRLAGASAKRVCKAFYQSTFGISHSQINTYMKNRETSSGNPGPDPRLNRSPANKTNAERRAQALEHIDSFPIIDSHYCRSDAPERKYLETTLSKAKMHRLYKEWMVEENVGTPAVSFSVYENLFDYKRNLAFHKPKKDVCDRCSAHQNMVKTGKITPAEVEKHEKHISSKIATREERHADTANADRHNLVVSFDLENVFSLPRTTTSSAFYKRKLNLYNLTAVVNRSRKGYCAIWTEAQSGRGGNDIASALLKLLQQIVLDHPETTSMTLWSDSCVPQNRNRMMSYNLQHFVSTSSSLSTIAQKFCEPGHSAIQDVDNLHSQIERSLKGLEIHSPVSLVRQLKAMRPNSVAMYIHTMTPKDFLDMTPTLKERYSTLPYGKTKQLIYTKAHPHDIRVYEAFGSSESTVANVLVPKLLRSGSPKKIPKPKLSKRVKNLTKEKIADLKSLLVYMAGDDLVYMQNLLR